MKKYLFNYGSIKGDLTAEEIKQGEKEYGKLLGVLDGFKYIPVFDKTRRRPNAEAEERFAGDDAVH